MLMLLSLQTAVVRAGEIRSIEPVTLVAWLEQKDPPLILDIRGRSAYLEGTLSGALDAGTDPAGFLPDGRGGDVVLLPASNQDLEPWQARLADYGYQVYVLGGEVADWHAAGLLVESPEASFVRPGTVPFVIPRGICELNEPAEVFD